MYISASQKSVVHADNEIKKSSLEQDTSRLIKRRFHKKTYPKVATELERVTSPNQGIVPCCYSHLRTVSLAKLQIFQVENITNDYDNYLWKEIVEKKANLSLNWIQKHLDVLTEKKILG